MLCQEWHQVSLTLLLVNCHNVTSGNFVSEFCTKQVRKELQNAITSQEKKIKDF